MFSPKMLKNIDKIFLFLENVILNFKCKILNFKIYF